METAKTNRESPSLKQWIWLNLKIGGLGIGGFGRVMLYQDEVVEKKKWLEQDEFQEIATVAQTFPGAFGVNTAAALGYRLTKATTAVLSIIILGLPGALCAVTIASLINLENNSIKLLFDGFCIGSLIVALIYVKKVVQGLTKTIRAKESASIRKIVSRGLLSGLIILASFSGVSFGIILCSSLILALILEFTI